MWYGLKIAVPFFFFITLPLAAAVKVEEISLAGQAAVKLQNNVVEITVMRLGMRIVDYRFVQNGRNAYSFDMELFRNYKGDSWLPGGEKETLFPGESWPRNGVWHLQSSWKIASQTATSLTVRFSAVSEKVEFIREMTLTDDSSEVRISQYGRNITSAPLHLAISTHPELAIGGFADAADRIFYYSAGLLEKEQFMPGRPGKDMRIKPDRPVWGVFDVMEKEAFVRILNKKNIETQYIYLGPQGYNLEEFAIDKSISPGDAVSNDLTFYLVSGMPDISAATEKILAGILMEKDVFGDDGNAILELWMGTPSKMDAVTFSINAGSFNEKGKSRIFTQGYAQKSIIKIPLSSLKTGENNVEIEIHLPDGETLKLKESIFKDSSLVKKADTLLKTLSEFVSNGTGVDTDVSDRHSIRNMIQMQNMEWSLQKAESLMKNGRIKEAFLILENAGKYIKETDTKESRGQESSITEKKVSFADVKIKNTSGKNKSPSIRITGRTRYESKSGLCKNGKQYFFFDLNKDSVIVDGVKPVAQRNAADASDALFFSPKGSVTLEMQIPEAGLYYPALRMEQYGDAGPVIAIDVDGKEQCKISSNGSFKWAVPKENTGLNLPKGQIKITLREACNNGGKNVNMALLDIFALTTDGTLAKAGQCLRENTLNICPADPKNKSWLRRIGVPLANPAFSIDGAVCEISGNLEYGDVLWIFPDKTYSAGPDIKVNIKGEIPSFLPGEEKTVKLEDAVESSHSCDFQAFFSDIGKLPSNTKILSPNDDGVNDVAEFRLPAGSRGVRIKNCMTAEITDPVAVSIENGIMRWSTPSGLQPGFYEIAVPSFDAEPRSIAVIKVVDITPLASADPAVFSPNVDGIDDRTVFTIDLKKEIPATVVISDSTGRIVKSFVDDSYLKGQRTFIWNGTDDSGKTVSNGIYQLQVRNSENGKIEMKASATVDSFTKWRRAPVKNERDFFPLGVYYTPTAHPSKLKGLDYHRALFKDLKEHNLNTVILMGDCPAPEVFDIATEYGLKIIPSLNGTICRKGFPSGEKKSFEIIKEKIRPCMNKESLLAYYLSDEPERNNKEMSDKILKVYNFIETTDPEHPPLSCLVGLTNIEYFTKLFNSGVLLIDIYPLLPKAGPGDFRRMYYTSWDLTEYTNRAKSALPEERILWTVVQAHNFNDWLRTPTPAELRLQVACSLAYGAKGIFFFLYQPVAEMIGFLDHQYNETDRYREVVNCCSRIRNLSPLLLKLHQTEPVFNAGNGSKNPFFEMVSGSFETEDGSLYLILANTCVESECPVTIEPDMKKLAVQENKTDCLAIDQETQEKYVFSRDAAVPKATIPMKAGDFKVLKISGFRPGNKLRSWYKMNRSEKIREQESKR